VRVYFIRDSQNGDSASGVAGATTAPVPAPATTAAAPGDAFADAPVLVDTAKIVEAPQSVASDSNLTISLLLKPTDAQKVVLADAQGEIAVGRLPVTGTPGIDLQAPGAATTTPTP
jgi:hypothetical protein